MIQRETGSTVATYDVSAYVTSSLTWIHLCAPYPSRLTTTRERERALAAEQLAPKGL